MTNGNGPPTREAYVQQHFGGDVPRDKRRQELALEKALDIRKFEIDLYWRRTAYFWAFIAAAFAGFFALSTNGSPRVFGLSYSVACGGFVLSVAWYCVNKASKAWQENWEKQVDLLEKEIIGPLYESVNNFDEFRRCRAFLCPTSPYFFSVSKINQLLSFFTIVLWAMLMARALFIRFAPAFYSEMSTGWKTALATFGTLAAALIVVFCGTTNGQTANTLHTRVRQITNVDPHNV